MREDPNVSLGVWLESKDPPVPAAFLERLLDDELEKTGAESTSRVLAHVGPALRSALAREGKRRGAFRLLAADAWITYACEAALADEDPETQLNKVLAGVLSAAEWP